MSWADLKVKAEHILGERWGGSVRLADPQRLSGERRRNLVLRCCVVDPPTGVSPSVVIKEASSDGYQPDDPQSRPAVGLFRDWAGLQFLGTIAAADRIGCPQFFGGSRAAGFFLMEDLSGAQRETCEPQTALASLTPL